MERLIIHSCVSSVIYSIGETLLSLSPDICCGGKGTSHAVTAARLGAAIAIIGKV